MRWLWKIRHSVWPNWIRQLFSGVVCSLGHGAVNPLHACRAGHPRALFSFVIPGLAPGIQVNHIASFLSGFSGRSPGMTNRERLLTRELGVADVVNAAAAVAKLEDWGTARGSTISVQLRTIWITITLASLITTYTPITLATRIIRIRCFAIIFAISRIPTAPPAYRSIRNTHPIITGLAAGAFGRTAGLVISRAVSDAGGRTDILAVSRTAFGSVSIIAGLRIETKIFAGIKRTFNAAVRTFFGSIYVSHSFTIRRLGAGR